MKLYGICYIFNLAETVVQLRNQLSVSHYGGMEASYKAFDRYPARKDVAEKVVPDSDPAKEMYSRYANECNVQGRPLAAQTMEFISDMGTIFQSCMKDEITVDEFCKKAQDVVDMYK